MTGAGTCLLSFSGGLDSLASAIVLKQRDYKVTLGHIVWTIGGTNFGEAQTEAAILLAHELALPLDVLAYMRFPEKSYAKYSWVPVCISTIMHHAGDPCEYPASNVQRYDNVAFGFSVMDHREYNFHIKRQWLAGMSEYAYGGKVLFPVDELDRSERAALVPEHMRDMTVCCYLGPSAEEPCGVCWKCTG